MLRILGYAAVIALNGESARAAWRESRGAFDLVIIDFMLADSNSADLATHFASEKPDLPCIVISGLTEDNVDIPTACAKYLAKPFTITQLREAIDALIPK
jgi:DNA-binding response OmpR family regulator